MKIINNLTFKAILKTKGRKTGKEHTVWAKAVTYNDMIYFSRRNPNSDWLKNAIVHPQVKVKFDNKEFSGIARLVEKEEELSQIISNIKYTEESRQKEARVVLEIKLSEND
ncbi:MAG: nitroreductase family deazaflavin-dependent oxidoreductase [Candidatus Nitrosopelagicus sp.]|nr:nitroreductase family deazaflavin-dependent oxidoreductase [Candidatus Nitrosopelagicus sp.]